MAPKRSNRKGINQDDTNSSDQNPENLLEDLNDVETVRPSDDGFSLPEQFKPRTQRQEEL